MFDDTSRLEQIIAQTGGGQNLRWFLVQLKPNCLAIATRNLERQGFRSFVPMTGETRRVGAKTQSRQRPLFPGYAFVALDGARGPWRAINSTQGVNRLVAFGGQPQPVPRGLVEQIALRCDDGGVMQPSPDLAPGDKVQVVQGPFADVIADVAAMPSERRVWILLDLMGHKTRVQVDCCALKRA